MKHENGIATALDIATKCRIMSSVGTTGIEPSGPASEGQPRNLSRPHETEATPPPSKADGVAPAGSASEGAQGVRLNVLATPKELSVSASNSRNASCVIGDGFDWRLHVGFLDHDNVPHFRNAQKGMLVSSYRTATGDRA